MGSSDAPAELVHEVPLVTERQVFLVLSLTGIQQTFLLLPDMPVYGCCIRGHVSDHEDQSMGMSGAGISYHNGILANRFYSLESML